MSDDRFVAADRDLDQGPLAVAGGSLPLHPSVRVDRSYMPVALTVDPFVRAVDRVGPRWNDDGCIGAVTARRPEIEPIAPRCWRCVATGVPTRQAAPPISKFSDDGPASLFPNWGSNPKVGVPRGRRFRLATGFLLARHQWPNALLLRRSRQARLQHGFLLRSLLAPMIDAFQFCSGYRGANLNKPYGFSEYLLKMDEIQQNVVLSLSSR